MENAIAKINCVDGKNFFYVPISEKEVVEQFNWKHFAGMYITYMPKEMKGKMGNLRTGDVTINQLLLRNHPLVNEKHVRFQRIDKNNSLVFDPDNFKVVDNRSQSEKILFTRRVNGTSAKPKKGRPRKKKKEVKASDPVVVNNIIPAIDIKNIMKTGKVKKMKVNPNGEIEFTFK